MTWPRRSGKDSVVLNHCACAAFERVSNIWYLLPSYAQARKALWTAVNPHTGKKRLEEAFPFEIRESTNDQEMRIVLKNGSSFQLIGSDSYNSLVGSTPAGVVFSEYALADPAAWGFIRPILLEAKGWAVFVSTPRGKNHHHDLFRFAEKNENWFAELLTSDDTKVFTPEQLQDELDEMIAANGEAYGRALWEQEYHCSFDASLPGAVYGEELAWMTQNDRIGKVEFDREYPVHTAWDLGFSDETAIWFWQIIAGELHLIDYHESSLKSIEFYADYLKRMGRERGYVYGTHWLPHDARPRTLASGGKSILQQLLDFDVGRCAIAPRLDVEEGIQATRATLKICWIDEGRCANGIEHLKSYRRSWDDELKVFSANPVHDQHSHGADAARIMSLVWRREKIAQAERPLIDKLLSGNVVSMTYGDLRKQHFRRSAAMRNGDS